MIRSSSFWLGVLAGGAGLMFLRGTRRLGPRAFTGGVSYEPKPLRRQGRRLRDDQARWNLWPFQGSTR